MSATQLDTDGHSFTHCQRRVSVCLTLCNLPLLLMSLLRIRMTPAALCVLDTKNNHSALTLQSCLSAHIEVLSLTTETIQRDLCPITTVQM